MSNQNPRLGIWISRILISFFMIGLIAGLVHVFSVTAAPASKPKEQAALNPGCALLDNTKARGLMSGMLETKLLIQCGRSNELGQVKSSAVTSPTIGPDVLVNDPSTDSGPSRTQSETNLVINETTGVLCSAFNDSYHYVAQGTGLMGFSSSTDNGASWVDHGVIPQGGGSPAWGDPALAWRKLDGHFYAAALHDYGLGFWDLGTDCTSASWVGMAHSGYNDDKELLAVDNNTSSPYYGRLYIAWTNFDTGDINVSHTDNLTTWSTPVDASGPGDVQGAWPSVDPATNDVYVAWVKWNPYPSGPIDIKVVRSTNGGGSFSYVTNPASGLVNPRDASATSYCGRPALKGNIRYLPSPQIAVDQNSNLHVVYSYDPDGYNTGDVINVYYRRSTDHGATWGPEIRLNDDDTTRDQFFPALVVSPSGIVGASWYDRRLNSDNTQYDYYRTISYDNGLSFGPNDRVSDGSSPVVLDPYLATCYHGDYDTSKASDTHYFIQWSDDRLGTPDVYLDTDLLVLDPIVGLAADNDSPTFLGQATNLFATIEEGTGVSYAWAFGDGTYGSGDTPAHVYPALGDFTATVTATNGLGSATAATLVTIVEQPIAGLSASNDSPTYLGDTTSFTASVEAGTSVSYTWDFGDETGGSGNNPTHVYPDLGIYTAVVTAENSIGSMAVDTIVTIVDAPITGLAANNDSPTELGGTTTLTATIASGTHPVFTWDFGDNTTGSGSVVTHIYTDAGSYTAIVTATNGTNTESKSTDVTITNVPIGGLSAVNDSPTRLGDTTTLTATIEAGTGVTYAWDFGDGATGTGKSVTHEYAQVGDFDAKVTATNSEGEVTFTTKVTIIPANFTIFLPLTQR